MLLMLEQIWSKKRAFMRECQIFWRYLIENQFECILFSMKFDDQLSIHYMSYKKCIWWINWFIFKWINFQGAHIKNIDMEFFFNVFTSHYGKQIKSIFCFSLNTIVKINYFHWDEKPIWIQFFPVYNFKWFHEIVEYKPDPNFSIENIVS